jgi:hypothetical protein
MNKTAVQYIYMQMSQQTPLYCCHVLITFVKKKTEKENNCKYEHLGVYLYTYILYSNVMA